MFWFWVFTSATLIVSVLQKYVLNLCVGQTYFKRVNYNNVTSGKLALIFLLSPISFSRWNIVPGVCVLFSVELVLRQLPTYGITLLAPGLYCCNSHVGLHATARCSLSGPLSECYLVILLQVVASCIQSCCKSLMWTGLKSITLAENTCWNNEPVCDYGRIRERQVTLVPVKQWSQNLKGQTSLEYEYYLF